MATIDVKDAAGATVAIEKPLAPARAAAAASRPVVLSTEDKAVIDSIDTKLTTLAGYVDGLEALSAALNSYVDGLETLIGTTNTSLSTLGGYLDAVETKLETLHTDLATVIFGQIDNFEGYIGALNDSAPASDTASASLNGRTQRIAQRITSLIALLPTALTAAGSLKVAEQERSVATASMTSLASSTSSQQLLAANAARKGLILINDDANDCLIKFGTTASATSYTLMLPGNRAALYMMDSPVYTGRIDAIWLADGAGSIYATET